jgi:protein SCO1
MDRRRVAATVLAIGLPLFLSLAACRASERTYPLRGQILAVNRDRGEIAVKHDAIPGLMPGMTMTFPVADRRALTERVAGDLIEATLVLSDRDTFLRDVRKIGFAELTPSAPLTPSAVTAAASGFELLKEGDPVPDQAFVDETGRTRRLTDWKGRTLAITFIYTRCPIPTFCPMMDRHFAAVQKEVRADRALRDRVKLLSISFDPAYDTPAVLRAHAAKLGAHADTWSFLTGDRDEVVRFAARLGVSITADQPDIAHNLRTAVVGPDGRLARVFTGNDWTPAGLLAALKGVAN